MGDRVRNALGLKHMKGSHEHLSFTAGAQADTTIACKQGDGGRGLELTVNGLSNTPKPHQKSPKTSSKRQKTRDDEKHNYYDY